MNPLIENWEETISLEYDLDSGVHIKELNYQLRPSFRLNDINFKYSEIIKESFDGK